MKKSILIMLITLISIFSLNEAKADECQACLAPKQCYVLNFSINGCQCQATLCYTCAVSNPSWDVDVLGVSTSCPGIVDQAWDYVYNWIDNNMNVLCGAYDCNINGYKTVKITKFSCAKYEWDGAILRIVEDRDNCSSGRCTIEQQSCYCNCKSPCGYPGCTPHWITINKNYYTTGTLCTTPKPDPSVFIAGVKLTLNCINICP